ncbi:MAG: MBG domain-containing protein, partial [Thermomicrobiales bacterium]
DVPFAVSATASSGLTVTFTASGNCSVAGTTVTITGAGSCAVTAHQAGNEGYDAAPDVSRTFSIAKASLSVTAQNATRPFGSSAVPCTVQFAGFVNGDGAGVVSGSATCTTTAAANSPAGQYPLIPAVGTLSATNYTFGPFVNGTLTIAQAATSLDSVRGTVTYGDTIGSVTARLTTSGGGPLPGATVSFTVNGNPAGSATTNAQGVASLSGVTFPAGLNAGTNSNIQICATFAGANDYLGTGPTCGPLVVGRRVLWIKPTDRTVGLKQPNPPADAHGDPACLAPSYCLELTRGSTFVAGQSWSALNLTNLRFQYARNPPSTNATEYVGKTYRMTAFGAISSNYDLRYDPGTMTVVAAP